LKLRILACRGKGDSSAARLDMALNKNDMIGQFVIEKLAIPSAQKISKHLFNQMNYTRYRISDPDNI
jgi:hypothetical protein